jgi:hypothetical protein
LPQKRSIHEAVASVPDVEVKSPDRVSGDSLAETGDDPGDNSAPAAVGVQNDTTPPVPPADAIDGEEGQMSHQESTTPPPTPGGVMHEVKSPDRVSGEPLAALRNFTDGPYRRAVDRLLAVHRHVDSWGVSLGRPEEYRRCVILLEELAIAIRDWGEREP